ncbi:MAG: hypothetical protein ACR2M1_13680 [Gemmatimonadaceae bacterium]
MMRAAKCALLSGAVLIAPVARAQGGANAAITNLLNGATRSLTDNEIVSAACKSQAAVQRLTGLVQQAQQVTGQLQQISAGVRFTGMPTTDLPASIAGTAYAKAAQLGATADQYAATFGLASVCNTQLTAEAIRARFDFLRNVVNRGIEQRLPSLQAALSLASDAGQVDPAAATRKAMYQRVFNINVSAASDKSLQVVDGELKSALELADRADNAARGNRANLNQLANRLVSQPQRTPDGALACATVDANGTQRWVAPDNDGTCGPVSPGAASLVTAAAEISAANDQQTLAMIEAAKVRVSALQARKDIRKEFTTRVVDQAIIR